MSGREARGAIKKPCSTTVVLARVGVLIRSTATLVVVVTSSSIRAYIKSTRDYFHYHTTSSYSSTSSYAYIICIVHTTLEYILNPLHTRDTSVLLLTLSGSWLLVRGFFNSSFHSLFNESPVADRAPILSFNSVPLFRVATQH